MKTIIERLADSEEFANNDAVPQVAEDARESIESLMDAAQRVVSAWDGGDLAAAVRSLRNTVKVIEAGL